MKKLKYIIAWVFALALLHSCNEGIDPISPADSGTDASAPTITISSPTQGGLLKMEEGASLVIGLVAEDDIELGSVSVMLDGTEVKNVSEFTDYRRYAPIGGLELDAVESGAHQLQITVTDKTGKSTSSDPVDFIVLVIGSFEPAYDEAFYMGMDNTFLEFVTFDDPGIVGSPGFYGGKIGMAYAGDADAYLTFPTAGFSGGDFSATFWYKVNSSPDRGGILTLSKPSGSNLDRNAGFRLFREGSSTDQILKLNVGTSSGEVWLDGGATATLKPVAAEWVHIAISISSTHAALYFDGMVVSEGDLAAAMDWAGCEEISIGSGAPNFTGWNHLSDNSLIDELRFFTSALSQAEIQAIIADEL